MTFTLLNGQAGSVAPPSPLPPTFILTTSPDTDLWRKPPSTVSFSAPILYRTLQLSSLKRARVTVSGAWKTLFDQGGLCLLIPSEDGKKEHWQWVKTGIEFFEGRPHVSAVACDRWADWSLQQTEGAEVTIEIEREVAEGKRTSTLWIYTIEKGGQRRPVREIAWVFENAEAKESPVCHVGVSVAKPSRDEDDKERGLAVTFKNFEVETWDKGVLED